MRHRLWANRLQEYIESVRAAPYDPLKHNCGLFVSGAAEAMTGDSPAKRLGISLSSMRDLALVLADGGVAGIACRGYGPMGAPLMARRGDIVIKQGIDGETLGVCMGDHALFLGPGGLQVRELTECSGSWRVD